MNNHSRSDRSPASNSPLGHAALSAFSLSTDRIHLNHGSYGAVPRKVQAEQDWLRAHIEADPTTFFGEELPDLMRAQAAHVARHFGGNPQDWVFCENATAAVSGVLASFSLRPGDEILTTSHAYGAVLKAMRLNAQRRGAMLTVVELPAAVESEDQIVETVRQAFTPRTRLLVIDHISSATALIFPVARIAATARDAGVAVLVDGAHVPGHLPLDVPALGADWYTGNAHKWLFAPRGCGLLWSAPARQSQTSPAVLSHGTGEGYTKAFDWIGTRDVTPWLCFEISANLHTEFGAGALMARNRALASEGASLIAERLGSKIAVPENLRGAMAAIPMAATTGSSDVAMQMRQALTREHGIVAPIYEFGGRIWVRISAQIYNQIEDYPLCAEALIKLRVRYGG
jgi:isopenicillin-N epimerase